MVRGRTGDEDRPCTAVTSPPASPGASISAARRSAALISESRGSLVHWSQQGVRALSLV